MDTKSHPDMARSVTAMIYSYVYAGGTEDESKKIDKLRYLIKEESGYMVDAKYVREKVSFLRDQMDRTKKMERTIAEVFGKDLPDPRYRMASVFCPECKRFKNYEKECPFCAHFEMTV